MRDLEKKALLQRFEPVLRFTRGEHFYPYAVDDYVAKASLWEKTPDSPPVEVYGESELDLHKLGEVQLAGADKVHYLHFISPLNLREIAEFRWQELRKTLKSRTFRPSRSRLARVGYLARIVDAVFSLSLLLRGRVPGDSMMAAVETFDRMLEKKRQFQYYGRVIQQNGWFILQYWYFYPFNNWRTGFYGANDHEADWEMVNIYCYEEPDGDIRPAWVGYASHDFSGDDLRRHWEDPEVGKVGQHPVVYVGGGSHASYFQAGEYLTQLSLPFFRPVRRFFRGLEGIFNKLLRESNSRSGDEDKHTVQVFTIPFVDYALGDGICIGAGGEETWSQPVLIDPEPGWVMNYRGLWGYYAQDAFSGEDAPGGPRYNRDGSVRRAWYDPLGWAGMEKVIPPHQLHERLQYRKETVSAEIEGLKKDVLEMQEAIFQMGIDLTAMQGLPYLRGTRTQVGETMGKFEADLTEKRRLITVKETLLVELMRQEQGLRTGKSEILRAHIQHAHKPQIEKTLRFNRLAEVWAAVSIGVMLIASVALFVFARPLFWVGLGGLLLVMLGIEAAFQRRLWAVVRWISLALALAAFLILLFNFFWYFFGGLVIITAFYMIIENLRELLSRR